MGESYKAMSPTKPQFPHLDSEHFGHADLSCKGHSNHDLPMNIWSQYSPVPLRVSPLSLHRLKSLAVTPREGRQWVVWLGPLTAWASKATQSR